MDEQLSSAPAAGDPVGIEAIRRGDALCAEVATRDDDLLADTVRLAVGPWTRFRGLMGLRDLPRGDAMLLRPCSGIHTFFMRFAIDALFLDRNGVVVDHAFELRPWRMVPLVGGAYATLELPAGTAKMLGVQRGDRVAFRRRK
ncbi:MAG: DUF192 domain-containing protein [Myxococcales bacterium]|nr:DUF192 domain-containing protein [Myxococcales bacterium]